MKPKSLDGIFHTTTQQDFARNVSPDHGHSPEELQHALDRSCTIHCVAAVLEMHRTSMPQLEHADMFARFLLEHGPHPTSGSNNTELYNVDDGWYSAPVADLLRLEGYNVVLQQLSYGPESTFIDAAHRARRVTSDIEAELLTQFCSFGGTKSDDWLRAAEESVGLDGMVIVSIKIPSSKTEGQWGRHSVLCLGFGEGTIRYFDPDKLLFSRYGESAPAQRIQGTDMGALIYEQPRDLFLDRMTGELMHIFATQDVTD